MKPSEDIDQNVIKIIQKNYKSSLKNPLNKILAYIDKEYDDMDLERKVIPYETTINDSDIHGKTIPEFIDFLKSIETGSENSYIDLESYSDFTIVTECEEDDDDYAARLYHTQISYIDQELTEINNQKKELQKEKAQLLKRLKEINSQL